MNNIKTGHFNGVRRNDVAREAGERAMGMGNSSIDLNTLEPSVKDKLVGETVRINALREQRERTMA
jgi:hypothetical protein